MRWLWPLSVPLVFLPASGSNTSSLPQPSLAVSTTKEVPAGERLIGVLNDVRQPIDDRVAAVRELARIKYKPAIPHLLAHMSLKDPNAFRDAISLEEYEYLARKYPNGPCVDALVTFGCEVITPAVKMYMSATTTERERDLVKVILRAENDQRSREDAQDFVRSFGRKIRDQAEYDRLLELYRHLDARPHELHVPEEWPKFRSPAPAGTPDRPLDHVRKRAESIG